MIALGDELGIEIVATNNVHYNIQKNHRINDVLVSIKHNTSIYDSHSHRRENDQFYLKSPSEMLTLFPEYTRAITNTYEIISLFSSELSTFQIDGTPVIDSLHLITVSDGQLGARVVNNYPFSVKKFNLQYINYEYGYSKTCRY